MFETPRHVIDAGWLGVADANTRELFIGLCEQNLEPQGWYVLETPAEPMFDRSQMMELADLAKEEEIQDQVTVYAMTLALGLVIHRTHDTPEKRAAAVSKLLGMAESVANKDPEEWLQMH